MSEAENLKRRLRELAAVTGEGDWKDVLRRVGEQPSMRRLPERRLVLALAAAVVVVVAAVGVFVGSGTRPGPTRPDSAGPTGTTGPGGAAGPTGPYGAMRVSLRDAERSLGGPIVLPDTSEVTPSDVVAVWMVQVPAFGPTSGAARGGSTTVRVTFPPDKLRIEYVRPPIPHIAAWIQNAVEDAPGSRAISLHGVPAFLIPQLPDGSNWGSITFVAGGTMIVVMGHSSNAFLEDVAQSIVDRTSGSG